MQHVQTGLGLGDSIRGLAPFQEVVRDEAQLVIAAQVFGPRPWVSPFLAAIRSGNEGIVISLDALGYIVTLAPIVDLSAQLLDLERRYRLLLKDYILKFDLPEGLEEELQPALGQD